MIKKMSTINSDKSLSDIQLYYKGKSVFVTGGTGFLGKFVLEKLLRSCNDLQNIYVLVRQKKGKDINTRLQEIYNSSLFERLKQEFPNFNEKLVPIAGDLTEPMLGISSEDRQMLTEKVNVIFHSAATVKFDDPLKVAMATNTQASLELLAMAKQFKHLEVLMHISTAYSNCNQPLIEEKIYKSDVEYETVKERVANLSDEQIDGMLPTLLGAWPNSYAFTKAMAERELAKRRGNVPLAIFRPSVVASSFKEPVPGWVDNLTAATGLAVGGGTGVVHVIYSNGNNIADIVPVDYVANGLIAASFNVQNLYKHTTPDEPPVYNFVSSVEKPLTYNKFMSTNINNITEYPFPDALWYPSLIFIPYHRLARVMVFLLHTMPAVFLDFLAVVTGSEPRLLKIYQKTQNYLDIISYFVRNPFMWTNNRTQELWEKSSEQDREIFPFSMKTLEWVDYFKFYLLGIRRYFFKVGDETLPRDRKRLQRLRYMHYTLIYTTIAILIYCLWNIFRFFISSYFI